MLSLLSYAWSLFLSLSSLSLQLLFVLVCYQRFSVLLREHILVSENTYTHIQARVRIICEVLELWSPDALAQFLWNSQPPSERASVTHHRIRKLERAFKSLEKTISDNDDFQKYRALNLSSEDLCSLDMIKKGYFLCCGVWTVHCYLCEDNLRMEILHDLEARCPEPLPLSTSDVGIQVSPLVSSACTQVESVDCDEPLDFYEDSLPAHVPELDFIPCRSTAATPSDFAKAICGISNPFLHKPSVPTQFGDCPGHRFNDTHTSSFPVDDFVVHFSEGYTHVEHVHNNISYFSCAKGNGYSKPRNKLKQAIRIYNL